MILKKENSKKYSKKLKRLFKSQKINSKNKKVRDEIGKRRKQNQ